MTNHFPCSYDFIFSHNFMKSVVLVSGLSAWKQYHIGDMFSIFYGKSSLIILP